MDAGLIATAAGLIGGWGSAIAAGLVAWRYQTRAASLAEVASARAAQLLTAQAAHDAALNAAEEKRQRDIADQAAQAKELAGRLADSEALRHESLTQERAIHDGLRREIAQLEADLATCSDPTAVRVRLKRMLQGTAEADYPSLPAPAGGGGRTPG